MMINIKPNKCWKKFLTFLIEIPDFFKTSNAFGRNCLYFNHIKTIAPKQIRL